MLYKVVLTFESLDKFPKCDLSTKSYCAVLSCGAIYYAVQGGSSIPQFFFYFCNSELRRPFLRRGKHLLDIEKFCLNCSLPFSVCHHLQAAVVVVLFEYLGFIALSVIKVDILFVFVFHHSKFVRE